MATFISRNPFAREELWRENYTPTDATCAWCGRLNRWRKLFIYIILTDGGRHNTINGVFCSVDCMRSYHD